jgi:hypothetical protein
MRITKKLLILAFIIAVAGVTQVSAQIASGQRVEKFRGIVTKRDPDSFTMGERWAGRKRPWS